jgi:DNA repair exonuclease SbcCD ATPase subunit
VILAGCFGKSAEDSVRESLDNIVGMEETFKKEQKPLKDLETNEHKLFEEIMALNMDDFDKIVSLSQDALKSVDEREERLKKERESIMEAKEEFESARESASEIPDDAVKKKAELAGNYMEKRYLAYQKLYEQYTDAIRLDKQLYTLTQNKNATIEELEKQVDQINRAYEDVIKESESFNTYTGKYNEAKKEFYQAAGFKSEKND